MKFVVHLSSSSCGIITLLLLLFQQQLSVLAFSNLVPFTTTTTTTTTGTTTTRRQFLHTKNNNNNGLSLLTKQQQQQQQFGKIGGANRIIISNGQNSNTRLYAFFSWPSSFFSFFSSSPKSTTAVATAATAAFTTAAISLVRGGGGGGSAAAAAAAGTIINLGQEKFYLESLATYGTVTALVMNASLRLYSSTKFPKHFDDNFRKSLKSIFTAVTSLCIISGAFTAVLFNILGIYTKSALGMGNDQGYLSFRLAAHVYTRWGFRSFLTTLGSFIVSFLLSLYARTQNENDDYGSYILAGSVFLALLAGYQIQKVLGLATKFIFTPEFMSKLNG